jgi:hypothetical protein
MRKCSTQPLSAVGQTGKIVTHMRDYRRLRRKSKQGIKTGDAIGFGRRDGEPLANVVERFRANPAAAILDSM